MCLDHEPVGCPEIAERVKGMAQTLGIEELLRRKPRALSGGQRQRVAMGRALGEDVAPYEDLLARGTARINQEQSRLRMQFPEAEGGW